MNKKEKYNLINLFKLFKNRPNHLVKFLLDNDAFTDKFLNDSLQEARRSVDQWPAIFRWSFRTKFGVNVAVYAMT